MKTLAESWLSSLISLLALAACDATDGATRAADDTDGANDESTDTTGDGYRGFVVLDPDQRHLGRDARQWAAAWWTWALALPATHHPLLHASGTRCDVGQDGPVYFIGSLAGLSRESERRRQPVRCSLPLDALVLVPIVNTTLDASTHGGTQDELRSEAEIFVDGMELVVLQIDGETLAGSDLDAHRVGSYRGRYVLPQSDSVLDLLGMPPETSVVDPTFGDGVYVLVALEPGVHQLHLAALDVRDPEDDADDLVIDVHYEITIADSADETAPRS